MTLRSMGTCRGSAAVEFQGPFGDVHRLIADALQFGGDAHGRGGQSQVRGQGLAQGQQPEGLFFNGQFHAVQGNVLDDHVPGQVGVTGSHREYTLVHRGFGQAPQLQQILFDMLQFLIELPPNLHGGRHHQSLLLLEA